MKDVHLTSGALLRWCMVAVVFALLVAGACVQVLDTVRKSNVHADTVNNKTGSETVGNENAAQNGGVAFNAANFPDSGFRQCLSSRMNVDSNSDGWLSLSEIAAVTAISCDGASAGSTVIEEATGIGYFTGLKYLNLSENNLSSLDLSQNDNLEAVYLDNNRLAALRLPENSRLWLVSLNNEVVDVQGLSVDLAQTAGDFTASRVSEVDGATLEGTTLSAEEPGAAQYSYDTGSTYEGEPLPLEVTVVFDEPLEIVSQKGEPVSTLSLERDESVTLREAYGRRVKWSSTDSNVASTDADPPYVLVTARKRGTADIIARSSDGNDGRQAVATVNVKTGFSDNRLLPSSSESSQSSQTSQTSQTR